jgi:hypothetical protein
MDSKILSFLAVRAHDLQKARSVDVLIIKLCKHMTVAQNGCEFSDYQVAKIH